MYKPYLVPVSIKGIVFEDDKVWLRFNQREEWELPGGKLDEGEQPKEAVLRELREELGFETTVEDIIQAHLYTVATIDESHGVLVVTYLCRLIKKSGQFELKWEEGESKFEAFPIDQIEQLNMPQFYKEAIKQAYQRLGGER